MPATTPARTVSADLSAARGGGGAAVQGHCNTPRYPLGGECGRTGNEWTRALTFISFHKRDSLSGAERRELGGQATDPWQRDLEERAALLRRAVTLHVALETSEHASPTLVRPSGRN